MKTSTYRTKAGKEITIPKPIPIVKIKNDRGPRHLLNFSKDKDGEAATIVGDNAGLNIVQLFQHYAKSRSITLEHNDIDHEINVECEKKELLGVFFELISNAFAYHTDTRSIRLRLSFDDPSTHASRVTNMNSKDRSIIVSVTGIGISPDDLLKLFYRFCDSENQRITRAELKSGFSLTKVLIQFNGGSIRIENRKVTDQEGTDTNFILILPESNDRIFEKQVLTESDSCILIEKGVLNDLNEWSDNCDVTGDKLKVRYEQVVNLERPDENDNPDDKFLCKLMSLLESNISDPEFNVSKLVNEIGMSRPVLFRKAKILTGSSIINLIRSRRLRMAEILLKQKKVTVSEVAFKVGYNDPKYFSKSFRSEYGKTPTEFVHALRS